MLDISERILVIKLSALGDLVLCFNAFAAIRNAHPNAEIALLTMPSFASFASEMPWFDRVLIDTRPRFSDLAEWAQLISTVRHFAPTRVYDFQGKTRQTALYIALGGKWAGEWSGAAPFCSHPRFWPPKPDMHYSDFVMEQLRLANVPTDVVPDLTWLDVSIERFNVPAPYALLIPGCAPQHPHKRWPVACYASLVKQLEEQGVASVAIGTKHDVEAIAQIKNLAPSIIDLSCQTSLKEVASLARHARFVIGNDTGPTHLAAAVGAPTVALMSEQVKASWSAPKGPRVRAVEGHPLSALSVDAVLNALNAF